MGDSKHRALNTLNAKQQAFWSLYNSTDPKYHGNATQSYGKVYGALGSVAQSGGSRLLNHPVILAIRKEAEAKTLRDLEINAAFVLSESVRLYGRAMGDIPIPHETYHTDPDTGLTITTRADRLEYKPSVAVKCLEQIGKHKQVQAFQDNVEHTHTHYLEQRLAAKSKAIEAKAIRIADTGGVDNSLPALEEKKGTEKRVVNAEPNQPEEIPLSEAGGLRPQ